MSMNLVGIAGVPSADMSGKLVGVGGCGCAANAGMGAYARPVGADDEPTTASKIVPVLILTATVGAMVWAIFKAEELTA
jgi:hypothetical protein